jgi:hypothetical protein
VQSALWSVHVKVCGLPGPMMVARYNNHGTPGALAGGAGMTEADLNKASAAEQTSAVFSALAAARGPLDATSLAAQFKRTKATRRRSAKCWPHWRGLAMSRRKTARPLRCGASPNLALRDAPRAVVQFPHSSQLPSPAGACCCSAHETIFRGPRSRAATEA